MATNTNTVNLNRYQFLREFGVDSTFIETVLLPGLAKQAKIAGASQGIELPHGLDEPAQYLPLDDAARIIIDYLNEHNYLGENETKALWKAIGNKSYASLANTLQLVLRERVIDPQKLLTARLTENLAALERAQAMDKVRADMPYNPVADLKKYNELRSRIVQLASSGVPKNAIAQLLPRGVSNLDHNLTETALINLLIDNLPELATINNSHPENREIAGRHIADRLADSIRSSYPELSGYLNFLYDKEEDFSTAVDSLQKSAKENKLNLTDLAEQKLKLVSALPLLTPTQRELASLIKDALPYTDPAQREQIGQLIMNALISSSRTLQSREELKSNISSKVVKDLGLSGSDATQLTQALNSALSKTSLAAALDLNHQTLHLDFQGRRFTRAERTLLKRGINPLHTNITQESLLAQARLYLGLPKDATLPEDYHDRLARSYTGLLNKDQPDLSRLASLQSWLDHHYSIDQISKDSKLAKLVEKARKQRDFAGLPLHAKWFEIEDTITGRRYLRKAFEAWDKIAEGVIVPIPLPGGKKLKIPILRPLPWIFLGIDKLKRIATLRTYRILNRPWKRFNFVRKALKWPVRQYAMGKYTIAGSLIHIGTSAWTKSIKWTAGKVGLGSAFKLFGSKAAGASIRTATRVMIRIGGKALAKTGTKVIGAILAAGTVIGSILSVLTVLSLALDLFKAGINLVKEYFHNVNFRRTINRLATIGTVIGSWFATLPLILGSILIGLTSFAMLVAAVGLGVFLFFNLFWVRFIAPGMQIDAGPDELLAAIICDESEGTSNNPKVNAAVCIVETLSKCNLNPLTRGLLSGGGWQCALAALAKPQVAAEIFKSTQSNTYFQCVGFIAATAAWVGTPLNQINACSYINQAPGGGYRYVSGTSGMQPGDFFVIDCNTGECSNSCPGHVGVVCAVNGALITACDANYGVAGGTRVDGKFAKSQISGYLRN